MSRDVDMTIEGAYSQSKTTADDLLSAAISILVERFGEGEWTTKDAIELCKVMTSDFNNSMICMKLQEIRDILSEGNE